MKEAIQKSIEGGWDYINERKGFYELENDKILPIKCIFIDPLFWQSLGKSLGWREKTTVCPFCEIEVESTEINFQEEHEECHTALHFPLTWKFHWHSFIDYLAEGKDPEEFFTHLLKDN